MENIFNKSFVQSINTEIGRQYRHSVAVGEAVEAAKKAKTEVTEKPAPVTRESVLTALYPEADSATLAGLGHALNAVVALGLVPFKSIQKKGFVPADYKSAKAATEAELREKIEAEVREKIAAEAAAKEALAAEATAAAKPAKGKKAAEEIAA